jgi:hypothetical protein
MAGSRQRRNGNGRAFRGLFLIFALTFVNFAGILLTLTALGGLEPWTARQFLGLFGVVELAAGASNIVAPNIWHLPVAEMGTSRRTRVRLAASALLLPHWGAAGRAGAGLVLILISGFSEGWSPESLLLLPLVAGLIVLFLGVSAAIARAGVAYPETDIVEVSIRWRGKDNRLQPLSLSASVQQFVLGILTLPAVKVLQPGCLFGPEIRPSLEALVVTLLLAALSVAATALLWSGRLQWRAPREQQKEAEANA